jgi:hypothetical protein
VKKFEKLSGFLGILFIFFLISGCRMTYYDKDIQVIPVNEIYRKKASGEVRHAYRNVCMNNGLKMEYEASAKHPVDLYGNRNVWIFYDLSKMKIIVRSHNQEKTSKMAEFLYDAIKNNRSVTIKMQEYKFYGSWFF